MKALEAGATRESLMMQLRKEGELLSEVLLTLIFDRDKENKPVPRASMTTRWSDDSPSHSYSNFQGIYRGVTVSAVEHARATSH
jgi:hypothetical protein